MILFIILKLSLFLPAFIASLHRRRRAAIIFRAATFSLIIFDALRCYAWLFLPVFISSADAFIFAYFSMPLFSRRCFSPFIIAYADAISWYCYATAVAAYMMPLLAPFSFRHFRH